MYDTKNILLTAWLVLNCSKAFASIDVLVVNESKEYDAFLDRKSTNGVTYEPFPKDIIPMEDGDSFNVEGNNETVANAVRLEYEYHEILSKPRCEFGLTVSRNITLGIFQVNAIFANEKDNSRRDKAVCSYKLESFDFSTGDAVVTFTMNRDKRGRF